MKCFEIRKCGREERDRCFVFQSYPDKADLDGVKCWIMNGAFQKGNKAQLDRCMACVYYKEINKESGIAQSDKTQATVISVSGAINNDKAKALEDVLNTLLEKKRLVAILNLTDVNNIYSCGLGVIIRMHKDLTAKGGAFFVVGTQPYVETIFESTRLTRFLSILPREADAFDVIDKKSRGIRENEEKNRLSVEEKKEIEKKKALRCWEFWNNHNPKNANTCEECFRKKADSGKPCWTVEGAVEGVTFQYVNEDCEDCEFYRIHQE